MIRKRNNHINLSDVSRDYPASMAVFVNYYTGRFESDLRRFFDISNDFGDSRIRSFWRCRAVSPTFVVRIWSGMT